jgi:hypothetical protein
MFLFFLKFLEQCWYCVVFSCFSRFFFEAFAGGIIIVESWVIISSLGPLGVQNFYFRAFGGSKFLL